jgi:uncharacterized protein
MAAADPPTRSRSAGTLGAVTTGQLIVVAVAIFAAAFVQMLAGFGFALLAMPVMTLAVPVEEAVVVVAILSLATTAWQSIRLKHDTDVALARRLIIASFVGMPLGLLILNVVDDTSLKIVLGICVLIATALLARRLDLSHVGPGLDVACGFTSGVLNTSLGTNGPPLVFDLQARAVGATTFRATISTVFVFGNMLALTLFLIDGKVTGDELRAALVAAPAWLLGQALGWPTRRHVHGERFRWLVLTLLFAAGVTAIVFAVT